MKIPATRVVIRPRDPPLPRPFNPLGDPSETRMKEEVSPLVLPRLPLANSFYLKLRRFFSNVFFKSSIFLLSFFMKESHFGVREGPAVITPFFLRPPRSPLVHKFFFLLSLPLLPGPDFLSLVDL